MATERSAKNTEVRSTRSWLLSWAVLGVMVMFGAGGAWATATTIAAANSSDSQIAPVGTAVAIPLSVYLTDASDQPAVGVTATVTFSVTGGGGTLVNDGVAVQTNGSGIATAGTWTLGATPGTNQVTVSRTGYTSLILTATGTRLVVNAGDNQTATVGTAVATPPSVYVDDGDSNPATGVTASVTFALGLGGGSLTNDNVAVTPSSGIYTAGTWTLGATAGSNTVTASATGGYTSLTFTATGVTVPGAPTIGTATAGNGQATVTFTAPTSTGGIAITGYTVTSNPTGGTDSNAGSTGFSHVVTGLTNGTAYTFTVTATNTVGTGAASTASNSVTPVTVPGAPTIGTATAGNGQATVTFTAPNSTGGSAITGYTVTSNPTGGTDSNAGSPGFSHVVTGLTNGTAYTFTVTATNAAGTGVASAASNSVTPLGAPGAPTAVTAAAGNAQATVTFTAPTSTGGSAITGYTVTSTPTGGTDSNAGSTGLSHVVTGLTNGTAYTFTVTATNTAGTGVASSASNSVTPAIFTLAVSAGNNQSATVGTAVPTLLSVYINDGSNQPATGVTASVTFAVTTGGGSLVNGGVAVQTTGGIATAGAWTLGNTAGSNTVTASATGYSSLIFTATGTAGSFSASGTTVSVASATVASGATDLVTLTVKDAFGNSVGASAAGGSVAFTNTGGTSTGTFGSVTNVGDGTYTALFTGSVVGTATTINATYDADAGGAGTAVAITSTMPTIAVTAALPGAPTITAVTSGNGQLTVAFTAGSSGGSAITGYEYALNGGAFTPAGVMVSPVAITGLTNATTYAVTIRAINAVGNGATSNSMSGTPRLTVAGDDQTVVVGEAVTLNGGTSTGLAPLTYAWTVNPISGVTLTSEATATPHFSASGVGTYTLTLTVTDGGGSAATDQVVITVIAAPVAVAGDDQTAVVEEEVTLDGGTSTGLAPLTYAWTVDPISGVTLTNPTTATPLFSASGVGTYTLTLTVTDGDGNTATDQVVITVSGVPQIQVPSSLSFGSIDVSTTIIQALTITNIGSGPLHLSSLGISGTDAGEFALPGGTSVYRSHDNGSFEMEEALPVAIESGGTVYVAVSFTPTTKGNKAAVLSVLSDDPSSPTTLALLGVGAGATVTVGPSLLEMGGVFVGTPLTASLTVTNISADQVSVTDVTTDDGQFIVSPSHFDLIGGGSQLVQVTFTPTFVGDNEGLLTITTEDETILHVPLSATGQGALVTGSPGVIEFGPRPIHVPFSSVFILTNEGNITSLVVPSLSGEDVAEFSVDVGAFYLVPGQSQPITVTFTPTTFGTKSASLALPASQALFSATVALTGEGHEAGIVANPDDIELGEVRLGQVGTTAFEVSNLGASTLTVSSITSSNGQFVASPSSFVLPAGLTQMMTVSFVPTEIGDQRTILTINSNDPVTPQYEVMVSGSGIHGNGSAFTLDFDQDGTIDFGDFALLEENFGRFSNHSGFDPLFDLDESNRVEYGDLFILADNYGRSAEAVQVPSAPHGSHANANANFWLNLTNNYDVGPEEEFSLTLWSNNLSEVKQFEITVEVTPSDAIDWEQINNSEHLPFNGFPALIEGNQITFGGVVLGSSSVSGATDLATLSLKTSSSFVQGAAATVRVVRVALGPDLSHQDVFTSESSRLSNLELHLNPPSVSHHRETIFPGEPLDIMAYIRTPGLSAVHAEIYDQADHSLVGIVGLSDNGVSPDENAGDQTFTGRWEGGTAGFYSIDLVTADAVGANHYPWLNQVRVASTVFSTPERVMVSPEQLAQVRVPLFLEDDGTGYLTHGFRGLELRSYFAETFGISGVDNPPQFSFEGTALFGGNFFFDTNVNRDCCNAIVSLALASSQPIFASSIHDRGQTVLAYLEFDNVVPTNFWQGQMWYGVHSLIDEDESTQPTYYWRSGNISIGGGDVDFNGHIGAFDASLVLMQSVGKINLWDPNDPRNDAIESTHQFTLLDGVGDAADVTDQFGITALDAAYILQREVGIITHFPMEEDYYRLWDPPATTWWDPPTGSGLAKTVAAAAAPKLHKVVRLGEPEGRGEQVVVPVTIDQMKGVLAGNLTLHYPAGAWQVAEVRKGELTANYILAHNTKGEELKVAFAGAKAPEGSGKLFEVVFAKVADPQGETGTLNLDAVKLNEDQIEVTIEAPAAGKVLELPKEFALQPNYPNPFNPSTTIKYDLPVGSTVELVVFDLVGQQVRKLQTGWQEAGRHQLEWDGRDNLGREVASGIYLYRLVTPEHTLVHKMMLLR